MNMTADGQKNKSHIKCIETWKYDTETQTNIISRKEEFDRVGHKTREITYNRKESPETITTWRFDKNGDCILQTINYLDTKEVLKFSYDYKYEGKQKIKMKRTKHTTDQNLVQEHHFSYSPDEIEERILVAGALYKTKKYNGNYLLLAEISHANNHVVTYEYDDRDNLTVIKENRPNRPDKIIKYRNIYDHEGRLCQKQRKNEISEFEFNAQNHVSKQRLKRSDRVEQVFTFYYEYYKS